MRSVGGYISKKRIPRPTPLLDPFEGLSEENVRTEPLRSFEHAIVPDRRTEISVSRSVGAGAGIILPDAAATMNKYFIETAMLRLQRSASPRCHLPKIPVAYPACFSTCARVVERRLMRSRSRMVCVTPDLNSCLPVIRCASSGCACRAHVKVGEPNAVSVQPVQIRSPDDRVAQGCDIAVTLIVRQNKHDVRAVRALRNQKCSRSGKSRAKGPARESGHYELNSHESKDKTTATLHTPQGDSARDLLQGRAFSMASADDLESATIFRLRHAAGVDQHCIIANIRPIFWMLAHTSCACI